MNHRSVFALSLAVLSLGAGRLAAQQSTGATFGEVISLGGTPSDIILDELRGRLYLVNDKANRIDVYDTNLKRVSKSIQVGGTPVAGAMSMDNNWLYVSNFGTSSLSVIDLASDSIFQTVPLPSRPEGVEVGIDGRVLINMQGTGVVQGTPQGTLAVFDRTQQQGLQLTPVAVPALPNTPQPLPPTILTRPVTTFRGKLIRTPDGQFIVGVVTPAQATTYIFVYEVASGVVLRNRSVSGQSSVLSMSPDGSRFMAGFTLYDTATLAVIAQQSNANAPFPFGVNFNVNQNVGGSAFSPDGGTLYSAFNVAPFAQPAPRPQASTLLVSDSRNLGINLGIKLPESVVAKMALRADGSEAWGLSESGLIYLPLGRLYDYPILQPETTQVFLSIDECSRGIARAQLRINNLGKGRLTYSVPSTGAAVVAQVTSGNAPSSVTFIMEPGRSGVLRRPGTNIWTNAGTSTGAPFSVNLASPEAINIPNTIRIYMNFRQPDMRGLVFPVPTVPNNGEGLQDMVLDEARQRLYITNSGLNRIEVFDTARQRFLRPIPAGQLPHVMALGTDGRTLYVGNTGGESISIIDLELGQIVGAVEFPPAPRQGTQNPIVPRAMAMGQFGLQFIMSNGSQWKLIGNQASVRPVDTVTPVLIPTAVRGSTGLAMTSTPDNRYIFTLAGNGMGYLYDGSIDTYTAGRLLFNTPGNPPTGYYGPLSASRNGGFFVANGLLLNSSLTVVGGSERPGTTAFTPPTQPGQQPTQTVVNTGQRNIAASAALSDTAFLRLTTPVRQAITTVTRDDERTTLEAIDVGSGNEALVAVVPENPVFNVFGTQVQNVRPRQLVVDSRGTAYIITLSGLSVVPLTPAGAATRPTIAATRGVVNSSDGSQNIRPGSFVTVSGTNLGAAAAADAVPPPTVLGGSCVTFNDVALPLLQTSSGQIQAQVPENISPGTAVVQVRSLATAQASDPVIVTVQRTPVNPTSVPPTPAVEPAVPPAPAEPEPQPTEPEPPTEPEGGSEPPPAV